MIERGREGWAPCPPGELERLAAVLRARRWWRTCLGVIAVLLASSALATATIGVVELSRKGPERRGGCSKCCPQPLPVCPTPPAP